jgi:hypothetical protein
VDQVSRPLLIALAAVVLIAGAWLTVLRPKSNTASTPPTAPGIKGLTNDVAKAKGALAASDAAAQRVQNAAGRVGQTPSTPAARSAAPGSTASKPAAAKPTPATPAKPKPATPQLTPGDRSGPILAELAKGKTVVMLFFSAGSADDHAALLAVRGADRHHGRVAVHAVPVGRVGDYDAITRQVQILQAPTTLVISPDKQARPIVGYTDVDEVNQTVDDAMGLPAGTKHASAASGILRAADRRARVVCGHGKDAHGCRVYLARVNRGCVATATDAFLSAAQAVAAGGPTAIDGVAQRASARLDGLLAIPPASGLVSTHRLLAATVASKKARLQTLVAKLRQGEDPLAAMRELQPGPAVQAQAAKLRRAGLGACA